MGFFNNKRTSVSSTSALLVGDTPEIAKDSIIASILTDGDIVEDLLDSYADGLAIKCRRALQYAESHYTYGLPQGTFEYGSSSDVLVLPILHELEGVPVRLVYNVYDQANPDMLAYDHLSTVRQWDAQTNVVSNPGFVPPVGSSDVTLHNTLFDDIGTILITYRYLDDQATEIFATETLSFSGLDATAVYYHVAYVTLSPDQTTVTSNLKYWYYRADSGAYPTLNVLPPVKESPYYPFIPIRNNNVDLTHSSKEETELYKTSKRLLDIIGLDYVQLGEGVNGNPDVDEIDQAYVYWGVDLHDDNEYAMNYLYEYFNYLSGVSKYSKSDYDTWVASDRSTTPKINRIKAKDLRMSLDIAYLYCDTKVKTGNIGSIGTVTRSTDKRSPYIHRQLEMVWVGSGDAAYEEEQLVEKYRFELSTITFRKQLTDTTYGEVTLKGGLHINNIYKKHTVETTIGDSDDPDNSNFVIPLNRFVVGKLPFPKESGLMYASLRIMFNSYKVTKLKWYETNFFKIVVTLVAVAFTISSFGAGSWAMGAATALGATGTLATVIAVILTIAVGALTAEAFAVIAKEIGIRNAFLLAVLATSIAILSNNTAFAAEFLPTTEQLLMASSALQTGINKVVEEDLRDLQQDHQDFLETKEEQEEELETTIGLLGLDDTFDLNPLLFTQQPMLFFPHESPSAFYERTVHTKNQVQSSLDSITNYVDRLITLPTPFETIK